MHSFRYLKTITFLFVIGVFFGIKVSPALAETKFIPTFATFYGNSISAASTTLLENFDLIDVQRGLVDAGSLSGASLWSTIKAANPNTQIYLYEMGPEDADNEDSMSQVDLTRIARFNTVPLGSTLASLNTNYPGLFLLDSGGNRINIPAYPNDYLMDFGSTTYQAYWLTAVDEDIINQPWVADGIFADNCLATIPGLSGIPVKYPTDDAWSTAMISFVSAISAGLHGYGQKLWCNMLSTNLPAGSATWLALDNSVNRPDVLEEEGAFAVSWGSAAVQFFDETEWLSQINTESAMQNIKVTMQGSTNLPEDGSGIDNWGKPVTFWQAFYYALGSFLLGKNDAHDNDYFGFHGGGVNPALDVWWYNEYNDINLGKAIGPYTMSVDNGVDIYWREFQKGYVVVNPTQNNAASWTIPEPSQQITHDNLLTSSSTIPVITSIALDSHNAAILLKVVLPPTNLTASAVSSSQINLSWSASTDSVGVAGYYIYRNGTEITTTTGTTYTDTGLAASTAYTYTVAAYDTAGNTSVQSSVVRMTTQPNGSISPVYIPLIPSTKTICSAFTYGNWNTCQSNGTQSRTVISVSPQGCIGGTPTLSQTCTYTPSVYSPEEPHSSTSVISGNGEPSSGGGGLSSLGHSSSVQGFTSLQIQSLLSLLSSFSVDSATVARIRAILIGTVVSTKTLTAPFPGTLAFGERSAYVTELQQLLIKLKFLASTYDTGFYGPLTTQAVKAFQSTYGVISSGTPATTGYGLVGPRTWKELQIVEAH